jgi:preprotein translocase subunit SecF
MIKVWFAAAKAFFVKAKILLLIGAILAAGIMGFKLGRDSEIADQARIEDRIQKTEKAAIDAAAEAIKGIRIVQKTIQRDAETVIKEVPVYRDCVNDDRVRRLLDDARSGKGSADSLP